MDRLITDPRQRVRFGPENDLDRQFVVEIDEHRPDTIRVSGRLRTLVAEGYASNVLLLHLVER